MAKLCIHTPCVADDFAWTRALIANHEARYPAAVEAACRAVGTEYLAARLTAYDLLAQSKMWRQSVECREAFCARNPLPYIPSGRYDCYPPGSLDHRVRVAFDKFSAEVCGPPVDLAEVWQQVDADIAACRAKRIAAPPRRALFRGPAAQPTRAPRPAARHRALRRPPRAAIRGFGEASEGTVSYGAAAGVAIAAGVVGYLVGAR